MEAYEDLLTLRPQILLVAGLSFLLVAAEAHAQSKYSPEGTRIRMAIALLVALLLFLSIRRGVPARGSRRWFWEAPGDELGPELLKLRERASIHVAAGAGLLIMAVLAGGYAVGDALVGAYEQGGTFLQYLPGPTLVLFGVCLVLGCGLLVRGLRMAPREPLQRPGP